MDIPRLKKDKLPRRRVSVGQIAVLGPSTFKCEIAAISSSTILMAHRENTGVTWPTVVLTEPHYAPNMKYNIVFFGKGAYLPLFDVCDQNLSFLTFCHNFVSLLFIQLRLQSQSAGIVVYEKKVDLIITQCGVVLLIWYQIKHDVFAGLLLFSGFP